MAIENTSIKAATLYHGTGIYCLAKIAQSDILLDGIHWGRPGEPYGPRLTLSAQVASDFILYSSHWGEGGILALDKAKLNRDFPLTTYQDKFGGAGNAPDEQEVVALTPAVPNLSQYLRSIICDPQIIEAARHSELMDLAMNEGGWPFAYGDNGRRAAAYCLDRLLDHPLLNAWLPPDTTYPNHVNFSEYLPHDARTASRAAHTS